MEFKLKALKANVLAVTTSKTHKLLSDAIGNGDKVLADFDDKVTDGLDAQQFDQGLGSVKNVFNDKELLLKVFSDAKTVLDA